MRTPKIIYTILFFLLLQINGLAQAVLKLQDNGSIAADYHISEKIALETDRELYMAGEKLHFGCYAFEPVLQHALDLSKIAYIEFYTAENQIIDQQKIALKKGTGEGFIEIPKGLSSGKYYLRAYTNYMKNYGFAGFSYSSVTVINPFMEIPQEEPVSSVAPPLQKCMIYPEGGRIVYGQINNVICRFSDTAGHSVACMARVLDAGNQIISTFTTTSYGLGSFTFIPAPGNIYRLEATAGNNLIEKKIDIPASAVVLMKNSQNQHELCFKILRYNHAEYPLKLEIFHLNTHIFLSEISSNDSIISIPSGKLPKGIVQFQLQDKNNSVLSYRNVYIPPNKNPDLKMHTNSLEYGNREVVELTIEQSPLNLSTGNLSVSVFQIEKGNVQDYPDYNTQEYLQSALYPFMGGNPYPASKVMNDSAFLEQVLIAKEQADFVSAGTPLTTYKELIYHPENKQDLIFGMISDEKETPVAGSPVMQSWIDTVSSLQTTLTNKKGEFFFESDKTRDQDLIITQGKDSKGKIQLHEEFYPDFFSLAKEEISINPARRNSLKQQLLNLQINDSFYEKKEINSTEFRNPFYIKADKVFRIADYVALSTLEEFLFEVVPGVMISHPKGTTFIRMRIPQSDQSFENDPLFLVDGIPVFDADVIGKLRCTELVSIAVIFEKYFFKNMNFDGILDIHTRLGDATILETPKGVHAVNFKGIQQTTLKDEFSVPVENPHEPFFKTQLYWNPSVRLNADGKTTITFTTPDNKGDFLIRACLKTTDGSAANNYTTFQVR